MDRLRGTGNYVKRNYVLKAEEYERAKDSAVAEEEITAACGTAGIEPAYRTVDNCQIEIPGPFGMTVFGASGDLMQRKLLPSLYRLYRDKLLPENFFILGTARSQMKNPDFRAGMREAVKGAFPHDFRDDIWSGFSGRLYYLPLDYGRKDDYRSLKGKIAALEKKYRLSGKRIYYLAVPPGIYEPIASNIAASGLSRAGGRNVQIVVEKPIGWDLDSSKRLNEVLRKPFREDQIYRIDHYLAKETVQNILMFRFANSIFEPLWNRRYVDHVQITVSETIGVGHRAGYYEKAGVIRDMFQNHLFQLLALTAMEPPSAFEAESVRDEKVKLFRSIRPFPLDRPGDFAVLGQYGPGEVMGGRARAYREEPGISAASVTPTFAALKVHVDNWRWNGVPFYLRSGKRLKRKKAEISIHYRQVPHLMFAKTLEERIEPNTLVIRVQPDEGISIVFEGKRPGTKVCLAPVYMDFAYQKVFSLGDYDRVLLDCMQGDQMLFVRQDAVEQTWALLTPLLEKLEAGADPREFPNYEAGSEGPSDACRLIESDRRSWRPL
ncbi:MAG: glucose-6-phosphate dehydrogenase [Candidatus Sulfobium sp.]|jgi:glucose-6-phosphate 1-dehydrogenase